MIGCSLERSDQGGPAPTGLHHGLPPITLRGPRRIRHFSARFTHKSVKGSAGGGEVCAIGEMMGHMELYTPFAGLGLGMAGLEACGILFPLLLSRRVAAVEFMARHFLPIRNSLQSNALSNVFLAPGP